MRGSGPFSMEAGKSHNRQTWKQEVQRVVFNLRPKDGQTGGYWCDSWSLKQDIVLVL